MKIDENKYLKDQKTYIQKNGKQQFIISLGYKHMYYLRIPWKLNIMVNIISQQ